MASYDSDSEDEGNQDFTETDVLLGFAAKDAKGETISRLGGRPDWLDPSKPPSAALARCQSCKDLMVLLLQLNAELPDRFPGHERRLYVFMCRRKTCRRKEGAAKAIRGLRVSPDAPAVADKKDEKQEAKQTTPSTTTGGVVKPGLGNALFGGSTLGGGQVGANPFSAGSAAAPANPFAKPGAAANPFSKPAPATAPGPARDAAAAAELPKTFAETLSLNNPQTTVLLGPPPPPEPWPAEKDQPAAYPVSWLADAEYETLDPTPPPVRQATDAMAMDIDSGEGSGGGGGKEDKEVFESSMDSTFQKFADRVGQNPEQCIRYEFGAQPLLYSKSDAVGALLHAPVGEGKVVAAKGLPRCRNCGAGRVFEVQLTPQAIEELEAGEEGLDGMDWGTVIVGVCEKDCQDRTVKSDEPGYLEEWVGVQWEELTAKR